MLQVPRWLEDEIQHVCVAITLNSTAVITDHECDCGLSAPLAGHMCRYQTAVRDNLRSRYPWVTYVILTELTVKILPSLLLLTLNVLMADRFYRVVERRGVLQARKFHSGESKLVPTGSGVLVGVGREETSLSKSFLIGVNTFSKKDKNILQLLVLLSVVFVLANLPMAVVRIMGAWGHKDNILTCTVNALEVSFAASNFYLYCLCNSRIRQQVGARIAVSMSAPRSCLSCDVGRQEQQKRGQPASLCQLYSQEFSPITNIFHPQIQFLPRDNVGLVEGWCLHHAGPRMPDTARRPIVNGSPGECGSHRLGASPPHCGSCLVLRRSNAMRNAALLLCGRIAMFVGCRW
jgi:hypothetical protein